MKTRTRFLMLDNLPTLPSLYYTWQSSWKAQVLHLQVLAGRPSILKPCPQRNPNHHNNTRQSTFSLFLSHFEHAWELLTLPLKLQKWIITLFLNFWGICSTPKLRIWTKFYVEVHLFSSVPSWNPPDVQQKGGKSSMNFGMGFWAGWWILQNKNLQKTLVQSDHYFQK